jgi:PAS domain S-box-containing protein
LHRTAGLIRLSLITPTVSQENDEEFGALGSILSWDDENEAEQVAAMAAVIREREAAGLSAPPDMVQFSTKDGVSQFSFLQGGGGMANPFVMNSAAQFTGNGGNLTLQLPLPTPLSSFVAQSDGQAQAKQISQQTTTNQLQQQQTQQQQQFVAQNVANFAQLFAQTGNLLQQNSAPAQPVPLRPTLPTIPHVQLPSQQQAPQVQVQFPSDPNAFLQQLQFAQLQQQMRVAQAQLPNPTQQQQLQVQFQQPQPPTLGNVPQSAAPIACVVQSQPEQPKRTPRSPEVRKKVPSRAPAKAKLLPNADVALSSMVSASDTDGEVSRGVKLKKTSSAEAKKLKPSELTSADMSNMTEAEKVKANRDRNREHARNTRLRKKAYLEKLKATVDDLCRERDSIVSERASAANLLVEMHNTRTEVLMSFFALRTCNEKRRKLWSSILDESCFTCIMPVTPYRSFPASEVQVSKCQRTIMGIDGMMSDTASLHLLLDTLVDRSKHPFGKISFRYTLVTEDAIVAGNQFMARWVMTTTNAVQCGANAEVTKQGMLCCKFNGTHKVTCLEIMFDVLAFMLHLKQAAGSDGFSVIPNTVQTCQRSFDKPMIVTIAEPPYTIIQVNKLWSDMTGYPSDEVVSQTSCSILQPPGMDKKALKSMMHEIRHKRPTSAMLTNVTRSGKIFTNFLTVYPLSSDSRIAYFMGLTTFYTEGTLQAEKEQESTTDTVHVEQRPRIAQARSSNPPTLSVQLPAEGHDGQLSMSKAETMDALITSVTLSEIPTIGSVLGGLKRPREVPSASI